MKQAVIEYKDIQRMKQAILKTDSKMLKNQYSKAIKRKFKELQDYCKFKNIDIKEVKKNY